jgi:hypothetical protein
MDGHVAILAPRRRHVRRVSATEVATGRARSGTAQRAWRNRIRSPAPPERHAMTLFSVLGMDRSAP